MQRGHPAGLTCGVSFSYIKAMGEEGGAGRNVNANNTPPMWQENGRILCCCYIM